MSAGPATILNPDTDVQAEKGWQLLKSRTTAQTAITALNLGRNLHGGNFAEDNLEFLDVSRYGAIRFQCLGVASNGHAPVIDLYGWRSTGPGQHIGKITLAFGNFLSSLTAGFHAHDDTHKSIRGAFTYGTNYQMCDTYTITNDYELEMGRSYEEDWDGAGFIANYYTTHKALSSPSTAAGVSPAEADFPSYVVVDFSRSRYTYFGVLVTTLNSATNVGAIWTPLSLRRF